MSSTPETDQKAAENKEKFPEGFTTLYSDCHVDADFARTLETQRDEARALLMEAKQLFEFLPSEYIHKESLRPIGYSPDGVLAKINAALGIPVAGIPTMPTVATPSPEIFEARGLEWYRHTPGDKMPCSGEMEVNIYCGPSFYSHTGRSASAWGWGVDVANKIIGWRPADAPEKLERK